MTVRNVRHDLSNSVCHRLSYEDRQQHAKNACSKKLLQIMARKETNLAVAADVATIDEMLRIADQVTASCLSLAQSQTMLHITDSQLQPEVTSYSRAFMLALTFHNGCAVGRISQHCQLFSLRPCM